MTAREQETARQFLRGQRQRAMARLWFAAMRFGERITAHEKADIEANELEASAIALYYVIEQIAEHIKLERTNQANN